MADSEPDFSSLPPATFASLIQMLAGQSAHALGLIPNPSGKSDVKLPLAKHFIDLLSLLQEKTKGNLTGHEHNGLEQALHELRLIYVERSKGESTPAPDDAPKS